MTITPGDMSEPESSPRDTRENLKRPFLDEVSAQIVKSDEKDGTSGNINNGRNNDVIVSSDTKSDKEKYSKRDSAAGADEEVTVLVTVPPDGGWGWVVVAASFVANFIVDGILYCYGDFLPVIKSDFNESAAKVSIPGSLLAGFYLMTGPFVSVLANKFGFQKVTVAGAIFAAAAFAFSSLAMNIDFLIFTYGILGGIGFGMIYAPSIVTVGYYFERWRGIATGIAVCGSGIGTFALSPLISELIKQIGWKNTFLFQGGLTLLCIICGLMFRPIKPVKVAINENAEENEDEQEEPLKHKKERLDSFRSVKSNKPPTAAEILHIADRPANFEINVPKLSKSSQYINFRNSGLDVKRHSVPNYIEHMASRKSRKERSMSHVMDGAAKDRHLSELNAKLSRSVECIISSRRGTITQIDEKVNLSLQRDDAYFAGSLLRLPQYKPRDSISYTLAVTRIPPAEEKSPLRSFFKSIVDLFDFSLLLSPSFDLLLLSGFLTMVGYFTPFSYVKDRAMEEGKWDEVDTKWLLSTIGITNTVGRVLSGLISGFPGMDATFMNNIALIIAGIATALSGLVLTLPYQYAYCAIFGFSTAAFASLRSIMVVDLLGLENLNNAFGILLFVQGFGSALGSPIAGAVREATSNYSASFYFSGILITLSGVILFPLKAVNRWEKRKRNKSPFKKADNC
ncbi:hypothetical protein RUM44_012998 [Polyplax serrata]|uniref:Major facilitator superfamily (MFS) profile domain-containing protein n=1 Tax=Polyplax serrata TaxID=468196 RepID=A0ABR1BGV7_POLSC